MSVTVSQLPDLLEQSGEILLCAECGSEWSATRGDYFFLRSTDTMTCPCGADLELVRKHTQYEPVTS